MKATNERLAEIKDGSPLTEEESSWVNKEISKAIENKFAEKMPDGKTYMQAMMEGKKFRGSHSVVDGEIIVTIEEE